MTPSMSEEALAKMREANEKATDWFGYCRKCGKRREGSLADLRKPCDCEVIDGRTVS